MKIVYCLLIMFLSIGILLTCSPLSDEKYVEVIARDFKFELVDQIPSGWTTFRFNNNGHTEHFFLLSLLPDSIPYERYLEQVTKSFDIVLDSLNSGKSKEDALSLLLELIPGWYFTDVKLMGGTGIISMGKSIDITLNLPPGTYAMECYIKEQGVFHSSLGMIRSLIVTEEVSKTKPPLTNMEISLSNYKFETEGVLYKGKNTFAVHFIEHPEIGPGNDVHIIKLEENTNLDDVISWLDWMNVKGLQSPAPAKFYGGSQEMPTGMTSYFTAYLEPGEYAFIAESAGSKGMVKKFTVK